MSLQSNSWYWCKSLRRSVKFIEICDVQGKDFNKAYVEFEWAGTIGGAYVDQDDLIRLGWMGF